MARLFMLASLVVALALILSPADVAVGQEIRKLSDCEDFAYSTEEDFVTQGPVPPDGNPIISDGDLLGRFGAICMRNAELVQVFDVTDDMGLDAVDVIDVEKELVAFSTELNSPYGNFRHGDLLTTQGAVIPNQVLLVQFQVAGDRGLDAVHFVGAPDDIVGFLDTASTISRDEWLREPGRLANLLDEYGVDIWFSIEGTELKASTEPILDGDLLSAASGIKVAGNHILLPPGVPAGIPLRGVDFGLDAVTSHRGLARGPMRFSTEILYRGDAGFTDGDVLKIGNGIDIAASDLYKPLEPRADFLGTDALYMRLELVRVRIYLPVLFRLWPN
jgi:hypothetical protein